MEDNNLDFDIFGEDEKKEEKVTEEEIDIMDFDRFSLGLQEEKEEEENEDVEELDVEETPVMQLIDSTDNEELEEEEEEENLFESKAVNNIINSAKDKLKPIVIIIIIILSIVLLAKGFGYLKSLKNKKVVEPVNGEQQLPLEEKQLDFESISGEQVVLESKPVELELETIINDGKIFSSYAVCNKYIETKNNIILPMFEGTMIDNIKIRFPIDIDTYNSLKVGQLYELRYTKIKVNGVVYLGDIRIGGD